MVNISGMRVNKKRCKSCPFNEGGCVSVRLKVEERVLTDASQLCHGTDNKTLCRGARDFQLQAFHRIGILEEPTDACWDKTQKEIADAGAKNIPRASRSV